ncbi:MAG: hypothetical protein F6K56_23895, partial [Moorea sp. SIO3G5]|nr:hypothetical protein [Moorena sp. SIO3G5]
PLGFVRSRSHKSLFLRSLFLRSRTYSNPLQNTIANWQYSHPVVNFYKALGFVFYIRYGDFLQS